MMKNKCIQIIFACLMIFAFSIESNAQISVAFTHPRIDEWHFEDFWEITISNLSAKAQDIFLFGTLEEMDEGMIVECTTSAFTIEGNYTGSVSTRDLAPVNVNYSGNQNYEDIYRQTNSLPAGIYTICVYVKQAITGIELAKDCYIIQISHPSPPELLLPDDKSEVTDYHPLFLWMAPMPPGKDVNYTIEIVELLDGQLPNEAIEANPSFYKEKDISFTSFQLPISAREFEEGKSYAWQVIGYEGNNKIGQSQVWSFTYTTGITDDEQKTDAQKCDLFKVDFMKTLQGDTIFYKLTIINKDTINPEKLQPKSFSIDVKKDTIISITGGVSKDWNRKPSRISNSANNVIWKSKKGHIPKGKTFLGNIQLCGSTSNLFWTIFTWYDDEGKILCKDSCAFNDIKTYYELSKNIPTSSVILVDNELNIQYYNSYASGGKIIFTFYDLESAEILTPKDNQDIELNSANGLNRISINLKDYNLINGKTYLLAVSDHINSYYITFKAPNQYEK